MCTIISVLQGRRGLNDMSEARDYISVTDGMRKEEAPVQVGFSTKQAISERNDGQAKDSSGLSLQCPSLC